MAKSFLMRDAAGRVGGYLICGEGTFLLKVCICAKDGAFIALRGSNGVVQRITACCDGQEHAYGYAGEIEQAALLDAMGGMLLSSGSKGASDGGWACRAVEIEKAEEDEEKGEKTDSVSSEPRMSEQNGRGMPEHRWPPPACMPGARYHRGAWREEQIFAKAQERAARQNKSDHS